MTSRQKILKLIYPLFLWVSKFSKKNMTALSNDNTTAPVSFYSLKQESINGSEFSFEQLKGKKVLIVNTASDCGYTNQYAGLEDLFEQFNDKLVVIGFPANDFKEQEKGSNTEIAAFCQKNYGVSFPLMAKSTVIKNADQGEVFKWLTDNKKNGWNTTEPSWNFCKYLIDENGRLTNYFPAAIEPLSDDMLDAINK